MPKQVEDPLDEVLLNLRLVCLWQRWSLLLPNQPYVIHGLLAVKVPVLGPLR